MTSPRVCLLSEPCQVTRPACSQAPQGQLRRQASARRGRGIPTRWAGSQPGLGPELANSSEPVYRLPGRRTLGSLRGSLPFLGSLGLGHLGEQQGGRAGAGAGTGPGESSSEQFSDRTEIEH